MLNTCSQTEILSFLALSKAMTQTPPNLTPDAWEQRYQDGTTRWDLGQPAPAFVTLLDSADAPEPGSAIVLGAGRGHDALLFAERGFDVVGVDFAPSAILAATKAARDRNLLTQAQFIQRDIFTLEDDLAHQFDYVVEHTCFCAIAPALRPEYVQLVKTLLKPTGEFLGLFFTHDRPGGPPYGSTAAEIRELFSPEFEIKSLVPVENSVPSRQGEEHLGRFGVR